MHVDHQKQDDLDQNLDLVINDKNRLRYTTFHISISISHLMYSCITTHIHVGNSIGGAQ